MLDFLLDLLLPEKPRTRELLRMLPEDFAARTRRSEGRAGEMLISLFDYRDPLVREAIWMLKYRGSKRVAELFSALLYDELIAFLAEYAPLTNFTDPLLIPIPLSPKRERERGFNQCVLLTDVLMRMDSSPPFQGGDKRGGSISPNKGSTQHFFGKVLGWCVSFPPLPIPSPPANRRAGCPRRGCAVFNDGVVGTNGESGRWGGSVSRNFTLSTALVKIKDTPSQTKTENRKARMKNLANCFAVKNPEHIQDRNIILIDDVATTGATLEEARRTLRKAGARKVIAFTVAH